MRGPRSAGLIAVLADGLASRILIIVMTLRQQRELLARDAAPLRGDGNFRRGDAAAAAPPRGDGFDGRRGERRSEPERGRPEKRTRHDVAPQVREHGLRDSQRRADRSMDDERADPRLLKQL
eukprot:COSAG01_NODE_36106_length_522_cov_0.737589_1_plen_121_part_10